MGSGDFTDCPNWASLFTAFMLGGLLALAVRNIYRAYRPRALSFEGSCTGACKRAHHSDRRKPENSDHSTTHRGEVKMVMVVNQELRMGKGKIGAQCGHAAVGAYRSSLKSENPYLEPWVKAGQKKIVVAAKDTASLLALQDEARKRKLVNYLIQDAGLTQVAPHSFTVLAVGPGPEELLNEITGRLKLL